MVDLDTTRGFLDYHYPLTYLKELAKVRTSSTDYGHPTDRYWLSVSRRMDDPSWEILTVSFRNPVSISEISFDLFEISQDYELWYVDRRSVRQQVLDRSLRHYTGRISTGKVNTWYTFQRLIYPIVATKLEIRIRRVADEYLVPSDTYSLGVRNLLTKRNIYAREDATQAFEQDVDPLGNVVQRYVKDWDPPKAQDANSFTFWKSEPQPDPNAVVSFYLDCRDSSGNAQRIDRVWLDPVYTGQYMNLYHSLDETVGQRKLSNSFLAPSATVNAPQVTGRGLDLSASNALYTVPMTTLGLKTQESIWFAGTWVPNFGSTTPPAVNLTIFQDSTAFVRIRYLFASNSIELKWGGSTVSTALSAFSQNTELKFSYRVVFAGNQSGLPAGLYLDVVMGANTVVSDFYSALSPATNANLISFTLGYCEGFIQHFFIKQDAPTDGEVGSALQDVGLYLSPDLIPTDQDPATVTTTTTNMVYGADFVYNALGYGGLDDRYFTEKEWTPMWVDWTVQRGFYYFPQAVVTKFIKLEFSHLTEEPYPIWEAGIETKYVTFPLDILKTSQSLLKENWDTVTTHNSQVSSLNGVIYDNYYSNTTYNRSVTDLPDDIQIQVGTGSVGTVPHLYDTDITTTISQEVSSSTFYRSTTSTDVQNLSADVYTTVVSGDWLIKMAKTYNIPWRAIYEANKSLIDNDPRVKLLPRRSEGWWIFPGQVLRIPAAIMNQITTTSTVTEKKVSSDTTTTTRKRFTVTSVHRYEVRTAKRDAAIAYFAGIREVQIFRLDYTTKQDTEEYYVPSYNTSQFTMVNMQGFPTGAWKLLVAGTGTVTSETYQSLNWVQKIRMQAFDRGLWRQIVGTHMTPVGLVVADTGAMWSDPIATWSDSVAVWGKSESLVAIQYESDKIYSGQLASRLSRVSGSGVAGVQSDDFTIPANARIRMSINFFRLKQTANPLSLQLIDISSGSDVILFQQAVPGNLYGKWTSFTSAFYTNVTAKTKVVIRFIVSGSLAEDVYIGSMYPETTTILYELSNDGGVTYYEVTEALYRENASFVFPKPGNNIKARVTLRDVKDFVYGYRIVPSYLVASG